MALQTAAELYDSLKGFGLGLPEAWEDFPWGETALKVRKKAFVFMSKSKEGALHASMKLPFSAAQALEDPRCSPTGYGLGKHGWVSLKVPEGDTFDQATLVNWVAESYRAVAPKTLGRQVDI